jgi:hypothetical protein
VHSDGVRAGVLSLSETLSVQQMLNCDNADNGYDTENDGCAGGDPITAMSYIQVRPHAPLLGPYLVPI